MSDTDRDEFVCPGCGGDEVRHYPGCPSLSDVASDIGTDQGRAGLTASREEVTVSDITIRPTWRHRSGCTYIAVFGDFFGNPEQGYTHEWDALFCPPVATRALAQKRGFEAQGSDDFNIAVITDERVVALLWMAEDMTPEMDQAELDELTEAIRGAL